MSNAAISITSIAARNGSSPGGSVYAGAKAFVSAFSKTLAKELVGHGIRVNCVSPGTIHTAFHDRFSDEAKREANLRFDVKESAFAAREGRKSIVPGDLARSELVRRITSDDPAEQMPPADSKLSLSPREIELLKTFAAPRPFLFYGAKLNSM